MDDLDTPRVVAGAESRILATLESHGLTWDGRVERQSKHGDAYQAALTELAPWCYACRCSRRELRGKARYPGTCRDLRLSRAGNAVRIRVDNGRNRGHGAASVFHDRVQGPRSADPSPGGDFVVWRRDGIPAYPLAAAVDD